MTVSELRSRMSSKELSEWMAFDTIEPIASDWRADARHAFLCAHLAALQGVKDSEARMPRTYMPDWDGTIRQQQTQDEMLALVKSLAKSGYGRIVTGG